MLDKKFHNVALYFTRYGDPCPHGIAPTEASWNVQDFAQALLGSVLLMVQYGLEMMKMMTKSAL